MTIETARAASLAARCRRSLDKLWRDPETGEHYTLGARLTEGHYAYVLIHEWRDGTVSRGLISHADAANALTREPSTLYPGADDPRQGLQFAAFTEAGKLVCDYAAETLPTVRVSADAFEVTHPITEAEWAHLTGGAA